ncbi:hypothetical protein K493DRAFT_315423 [Basidiobolus meristosporus CBS 931.73]|uniref:Uncharacterized protein n=1 Tax=Basidiobolus meristosporus CBS 931.73 TaxID=1314790 RepID=A0A1Y1Y980_9FUNG|nr:hypothetical protein K493DRAFT_315423 [Basidiobolus meristosporus CBS 931.73]|eukprot:ORX94561.1 hypothetical protein K493DRAFT_315423 [Basidiobolus meristosporus CBS 931.73]
MTLDYVGISLVRAFSPGQGYVAISRARSLENLQLDRFNPLVIRAHPLVKAFYQNIKNNPAKKVLTHGGEQETKNSPELSGHSEYQDVYIASTFHGSAKRIWEEAIISPSQKPRYFDS